jgi:hypothetical protein
MSALSLISRSCGWKLTGNDDVAHRSNHVIDVENTSTAESFPVWSLRANYGLVRPLPRRNFVGNGQPWSDNALWSCDHIDHVFLVFTNLNKARTADTLERQVSSRKNNFKFQTQVSPAYNQDHKNTHARQHNTGYMQAGSERQRYRTANNLEKQTLDQKSASSMFTWEYRTSTRECLPRDAHSLFVHLLTLAVVYAAIPIPRSMVTTKRSRRCWQIVVCQRQRRQRGTTPLAATAEAEIAGYAQAGGQAASGVPHHITTQIYLSHASPYVI